jgi:hypothetical protein
MKKLVLVCLAILATGSIGVRFYLDELPSKIVITQQTQAPTQSRSGAIALAPSAANKNAQLQTTADGVAAAEVANPDVNSSQVAGTPGGYRHFQAGNYFAALQAFESARWQDMDALTFYGDLLNFCKGQRFTNRSQLERWIATFRATPTPTTESEVWITSKSFEICANFRAPPLNVKTMPTFSALARKKKAEIGPVPAAEARRNWFDQRVVNAKNIDTLWQLADGRFKGAIGADYFNLNTQQGDEYSYNNSPDSASLTRAQTIAIMRLRCDMTHACGPEQLDSLLVCNRYRQCRAGIAVEEVWRSVASPYELQAAQAIYQQYVALRAAQRN